MIAVRWIFALGVGGFLLMMGVTKFTGGAHIFPFIEYKAAAAGFPLAGFAYPLGHIATGALEVIAGVLLILPMTRKIGAQLCTLPLLGAVVFHLSPLLGVTTPTGFADPKPVEALAAGGPFARTDFAALESNTLFAMATGMLVVAITNLIVQRNS